MWRDQFQHFDHLHVLVIDRFTTGYEKYGPVCRFWMGVMPFFVVFEPEHLQTILGSAKHTEKAFFYRFMHNFLGSGLITSSGTKWLTHRKYLQPTFHISILEKFIETFAESAQCLHEKLHNQRQINITSFINECVLDILNGKLNAFTNEKHFSCSFHVFSPAQSQFSEFQLGAISHRWRTLRSDGKLNFFFQQFWTWCHCKGERKDLQSNYNSIKKFHSARNEVLRWRT